MNNYIECAHKKMWVCFDLDNGHSSGKKDAGKGYAWIFRTREEARQHIRNQKTKKFAALLSSPRKLIA